MMKKRGENDHQVAQHKPVLARNGKRGDVGVTPYIFTNIEANNMLCFISNYYLCLCCLISLIAFFAF